MRNQINVSSGLSFGSILFFIFLVMKLTHYIDWSWWLVTAPLWLPITVVVGFIGVMGLVGGLMLLISMILASILDSKK